VGLDDDYFKTVEAVKNGENIEWTKHVTTLTVGGESPSLWDNDPVSFLSGGYGNGKEIVGPGVPKRLKAHSISNFVTDKVVLVNHEKYTIPSRKI
jgi:hypothetical protein